MHKSGKLSIGKMFKTIVNSALFYAQSKENGKYSMVHSNLSKSPILLINHWI